MQKEYVIIAKWREAFTNKAFKITLFSAILILILVIHIISYWMLYNETRIGSPLNDWILTSFAPIDLSIPLFLVTNVAAFLGLFTAVLLPYRLIKTILSIINIAMLRMLTIYLVPLEPPIDIIPLRDPFMELFLFEGHVLLKDLFFSGHTANLLTLCLLTPFKKIRLFIALSVLIVAPMLLLQHVHYTIDVLAAPIFAVIAVGMANDTMNVIFKRPLDLNNTHPIHLIWKKDGMNL